MRQRIEELDYLKGIFIILMITFHLVYIGDSYPYAKRIVHTFHMPGFLIISGFLMNISKPWKDFFKTMLGYAIPYCIMESGYIVMASALPIREHVDVLTFGVFVDMLLLHPIGPYWYLQTLICCGIAYVVIIHFVPVKANSQIILLGIVFHLLSNVFGVMSFACSLYFLAGLVLRHSGIPFTNAFQPSAVAIFAFVLLAIHPQNLLMERSGGVLMVYLAIVGFLFAYSHIGQKTSSLLLFLGRNTMPLFLFSPIFTFLCKPLVPVLQFEPTGLLFLLLSLIICITGSLSVESVMNRVGLSQYFYYKR
ncbi:MAG: acyltransferase family protein [Aeriscardovia sp.]|nr:acyltransferase family protein [Aeriscardovia sp.]